MTQPADNGTPLRVFIGPVEIAGHYSRLAAGLRQIGVDAISVDLGGHPFRYAEARHDALVVRMAVAVARRSRRPGGARVVKAMWRPLEVLTRILLLLWSLQRFDAFVFGFGTTLLYGRELPLLRRLGKRIVFVFNGSDARPPYVDGADMAASLGRSIDDCVRMTRRKKANIAWIERHADAIVAQPTFSHFFQRPVVDFFRLGVPWTPHQSAVPPRAGSSANEVRVLHSPSHPEVKGSERIRRVVDELIASGLSLRLVELRGVPNETVRDEVGRADFVIDQLYSDAPMVGFATEAASAGVAAVVGGYAWPELRRIYPDRAMPPVEACHPDELATAIRRLAEDPTYRAALGARARRFVEETWSLARIAERYLDVIEGRIPEEWLFDPRGLGYVRGVGMTEERARQLVRGVLERGGRAALELTDKPALEQAFVDFAYAD